MSSTTDREAWARLEAMLTAMHTGAVITVDEVVAETGIAVESVEVVLEALARAHLFQRHGQHFMRVSLFDDAAEQERALGALLRQRQG
jgi:hypothetical protein